MASTLLNHEETKKLKLVCQTVVERGIQDDETGRNVFRKCEYCFQSDWHDGNIQHMADCAYVAAKALMEEIA